MTKRKIKPHLRKIKTKKGLVIILVNVSEWKKELMKTRGYVKEFPREKEKMTSNKLWNSLRRILLTYEKIYQEEKLLEEKEKVARKILDFLWKVYGEKLSKREMLDEGMLEMLTADDLTDEEKERFKESSWYFEMRDFYETYSAVLPNYVYVPEPEEEEDE